MKIIHTEYITSAGQFPDSKKWESVKKDIHKAIKSIEWPTGSGSFTLHEESGKKRREGNGVKPIKLAFMEKLKHLGWNLETPVDIASVKRPGPMDATFPIDDKLFCVEWETGNISSSHRALNKMALGIIKNILIGGILILPTRNMYSYLTDRVGNYPEIEPYFPLWKALQVKEGILAVIAIEHDGVSKDVPRIPKGTDGRALQ
ncbi:MAG: hypothetical protein JXL81_11485 [Deltaproteobacteria bacterium]|nr:hypothetical protein [Deltaproteobacteria bacterium]